MATLSDLLAQTSSFGGAWVVSDVTREVSIPAEAGLVGVTSDELVRPVRFRLPRFYFGTDLAEFNIRINYRNAAGVDDLTFASDVEVGEEEIEFTWNIPRLAMAASGLVEFSVCCVRLGEDGSTVLQEFNTVPKTFEVKLGLEANPVEVERRLDWFWDVVEKCEAAGSDATEAARYARDLADKAKEDLTKEETRLAEVVNRVISEPRIRLMGTDYFEKVDGSIWLESDETAQTITAIKRWDAKKAGNALWPSDDLFPGDDVYPEDTGEWTEFKLAPSVLA